MLKRRNIRALSFFAMFYVLFGVGLYTFQERVVYQPSDQDFTECARLQDAKRVVHNSTRMYVRESTNGMVVVYHGNGGSACDRDYLARSIIEAGLGYILVEYAGYSNDTEHPSHERIKENVRDVIEYLGGNNYINPVIVGESIGTGVASYHVSLEEPHALLLISPFYDLTHVAKYRFWFYPASLLTDNAFTNSIWLQDARYPITIIHGDGDTLVPYDSGQKLFNSLAGPDKVFVTIPGAGHNNLFAFPETYSSLSNFMRTVSPVTTTTSTLSL